MAAAREVREKLLRLASEQLEIAVQDLELVDGEVKVKERLPAQSRSRAGRVRCPDHRKGLQEAAIDNPACEPESGCLRRLGFESFLEPQVFTHAARIKVDRATGVVRVLHVAAVHDSGVIVNRAGADGQVYGGVVMGIGQALLEASQLSEEGASSTRTSSTTSSSRPRTRRASTSTGSRRRRRTAAREDQGSRRAADRPDAGRDRERDCARDRGARARLR